jgi:hypothetical protein
VTDFEKLGSFYLGKEYDLAAGSLEESKLVLYDSKDLTTHGVIIGMTGSGKTGLGICLLEEALIDNIPVIAVDPKGDLGNLLLTFPDLSPSDFRPWINEQDAATKGMTPDQYASAQAELWKKGLSSWGQDGERIRKLREAVSFGVYTPGSSAGRGLSVLRSFAPPAEEVHGDSDLWRETVQSTATGVLALLGIDADPLSSREHILVANILEKTWERGESLDLAGLIHAIQAPPFDRLGVLDLESFFPAKDRFALAMRVNNLLASAGFAAWLEGDPLDVQNLLYGPGGRPKASIVNIAHLSDRERMFFMTILLNRVISWMRAQSGTTSLRAILYIDELFGFFPPVANPPTKNPLLLLLKQARAFGLGVVLSTQNPVDIDYKGLSNCGTWFLGRLQTDQDKQRVLDGLEGAAAGGRFDRASMSQTLSAVGKRTFLLHNVHESEPVIFQTRWAMSYLAGPMSRDQIRKLASTGEEPARPASAATIEPAPASAASTGLAGAPPVVPPGIDTWYLRASGAATDLVYVPVVASVANVHYLNAAKNIDHSRRIGLAAIADDDLPAGVEWSDAEAFDVDPSALETRPLSGATFAPLPRIAGNATSFARVRKSLLNSLRQDHPLTIFRSPTFKETSRPGENEDAFRARLSQRAREHRDLEAAKLRKKYEPRFRSLEDKARRAREAVAREESQASQKKLDATLSLGTTVLGALFGRKTISATTISRASSTIGKASRAGKESQDVGRAKERVDALARELEDLHAEMNDGIARLEDTFDPASENLEEIQVRPKATDIELRAFGLVWRPMRRGSDGRLLPDWK